MPGEIIQTQQRVIVAKLLLDILRDFGASQLKTERFGTHSDDLLLHAALFIGQAEGRPMTAAKLATYAGLARPSVVRRLNEWSAAGLVERQGAGYVLPLAIVNSKGARQAAEAAQRRVVAAAQALNQPI